MKCHLIAMGNRMPAWVNAGFKDYADRMPKQCELILHEIPLKKRGKNADLQRIMREEGELMLAAVPQGAQLIMLDCMGTHLSTQQFAAELEQHYQTSQDFAILIGGPEGLSSSCLQQSTKKWSLSTLTFPHPLVRVIFAEQLYRAWTIHTNHPYHK